MIQKKIKLRPEAFWTQVKGLLTNEKMHDRFVFDLLSGLTGKTAITIEFVLVRSGLSLQNLASMMYAVGVRGQKIVNDCSSDDSYKPALVAELFALEYKAQNKKDRIIPIMPPRNEARNPYVLSLAFIYEAARYEDDKEEAATCFV